MDYGAMLSDSFSYVQEAVWGRWRRWFLLLVCMIIFPFLLGYIVRIYRGDRPAPELGQWGSLFVDGLKLFIIELLYAAPVILLFIIAFLPFLSTLVSAGLFTPNAAGMTDAQADVLIAAHPDILAAVGTMLILIIVAVILAIITGLFSFVGTIRFARTGLISEGFNFSAILATIRKMGWINYLLALIIIGVASMVYGFVMDIVMIIPFAGFIIWFFLYPPLIIFVSRYAALVYDHGEVPAMAYPGPPLS